MKYISHLDLVRFIYRALHRTDLPYVLTNGFNRHPKLKFGQALKLGKEAEIEVSFFFSADVGADEFKKQFEQQLTEGLKILSISYG